MGKKRRNIEKGNQMSEQQQDQATLDQGQSPEEVVDQLEESGQVENEAALNQEVGSEAPATDPKAEGQPAASEDPVAGSPEASGVAGDEAPAEPEAPTNVEEKTSEVPPAPEEAPAAPVVADAPTQPVEPAPVEPVADQPADVQSEDLSEGEQYLAKVRSEGTELQKIALRSLDAFCDTMKPRAPISEDVANGAQRDLLSLFLMILRKDYDEFRKAWSTVLVYFDVKHGDNPTAANYTALSEYSTMRHIDTWKDAERVEGFITLLTLVRATRKLATRKNDVKRVLLDKVAVGLLSTQSRENLQRFYA